MTWLTEVLPALVVLAIIGEVGLIGAVLYVRAELLRAIGELEQRVDVLIRPKVDP